MCGSEQEEETSVRSMGQWDNIGNIIDKMLRFNDHHIEHELERVTSLRTLCDQAANSLKSHQVGSPRNCAPAPSSDVRMKEIATSTSDVMYCGGPSEI